MNFTERETKIIDRLITFTFCLGVILPLVSIPFEFYFGMFCGCTFLGIFATLHVIRFASTKSKNVNQSTISYTLNTV